MDEKKGKEKLGCHCVLALELVLGLLVNLLVGCATQMTVTSQLEKTDIAGFHVKGKVIYEGKREYLPRTISEAPESNVGLIFRYSYQEVQKRGDSREAAALFNPLTIVGFPTGGTSSTILGRLDALKGSNLLKSYTSTCSLEVTRTIFSDGESFSELRRKGLIAVRDNIEIQMYQDKEFLEKASKDESR